MATGRLWRELFVTLQLSMFNISQYASVQASSNVFIGDILRLGRDLVVTTGTHEVLKYPNKGNSPTDIFLATDFVPAPKYYWKVVQDPQTKTGAAFIGLNDPHTNVAPEELCKNRCSEMGSWVDWDLTNLDSGYMYCCAVEDAAKAIKV